MNFNELTEALYDKLFLPMAGLLVALSRAGLCIRITAQMSCGTTPVVRTLAGLTRSSCRPWPLFS